MCSNHPTDLADSQRALLRSAVAEGYFQVPRRISTVELAEKNGMTDKEVLAEMRRSLDVVIRDAGLTE